MPTPMAQKADQKAALEAARAALMVVHSAAAISLSVGKTPSRLLRAAEGLVRLAIAGLIDRASVAPAPAASAECAGAEVEMPKTPKNRKKKKKKKKKKAKSKQEQLDVDMGLAAASPADASDRLDEALAKVGPGGSVVMGDLTELGISTTQLLVPAASSSSASRALGADGDAQQSSPQWLLDSLSAHPPLVLRGWCKEANLWSVGKKKALVARLAGATSSSSSCGALRSLATTAGPQAGGGTAAAGDAGDSPAPGKRPRFYGDEGSPCRECSTGWLGPDGHCRNYGWDFWAWSRARSEARAMG